MPFRVAEKFVVKAPAQAVWAYVVDPRQVIACLPGAELTAVVDERTFDGGVQVKVGPVVASYRGRVRLLELDPAAGRVRLLGVGREGTGSGSAKMTMETTMAALPDGGTDVAVCADVEVVGRAAQLGRGMMEQVAVQILHQFAERVRATLEAQAVAAGAGHPPASPQPAEPVRAVPLLLRALWAAVAGLFRRWFGRAGSDGRPR